MDGMLVHRRVTPSTKFAGTHLYTWVERGTVRVKCIAQEDETICHLPGLELRPPDPKTSTRTILSLNIILKIPAILTAGEEMKMLNSG